MASVLRLARAYDALWLTLAAWAIVILFAKAHGSALRADLWLPPIALLTVFALFAIAIARSSRHWRPGPHISILTIPSALFGLVVAFGLFLAWYMCCP